MIVIMGILREPLNQQVQKPFPVRPPGDRFHQYRELGLAFLRINIRPVNDQLLQYIIDILILTAVQVELFHSMSSSRLPESLIGTFRFYSQTLTLSAVNSF